MARLSPQAPALAAVSPSARARAACSVAITWKRPTPLATGVIIPQGSPHRERAPIVENRTTDEDAAHCPDLRRSRARPRADRLGKVLRSPAHRADVPAAGWR